MTVKQDYQLMTKMIREIAALKAKLKQRDERIAELERDRRTITAHWIYPELLKDPDWPHNAPTAEDDLPRRH